MDLLIVLTYVALAWAVFKIFRIPVNQWTLATAALGGVFSGEWFDFVDELQPPLHFYRAKGSDSDPHHATGDGNCY